MTRAPRSFPALALASVLVAACAHTPDPAGRPPPCPDLTDADATALVAQASALLERDEPDALDRALVPANRLERCRPDHPDRTAIEDALRRAAIAESQALVERGEWAQARFALARFEGRLDVTDPLRLLELSWAEAQHDAALRDERSGRLATAFVRSCLTAGLRRQAGDIDERERLKAAFLEHGALAVSLVLEGPTEPRQQLEQALESGLSPLFRWQPAPDEDAIGRLLLSDIDCQESTVQRVATLRHDSDGPSKTRARAEADLARAEAALAQAALEDRRLRKALEDAERDDPGRRSSRALERAEVQAVARARDILETLPREREGADHQPFSYQVDVGTLTCIVRADLELRRQGEEPLQRSLEVRASATDSSHAAHVEWDLAEDPMVYPRDRSALGVEGIGKLVAELDALLRDRHSHALVPPPPDHDLDPDDAAALERATHRALLAQLADPQLHHQRVSEFLRDTYGFDDWEWLVLP